MKQRGVFEKVPGSGEWWICYFDQTGRRRREKAGTKSAAIQLYRKRKQQILEGVKLPEKLRRRAVPFAEIAKDTLEYSKATKVEEAYRIDGWKMETILTWFRGRSAEEITPQDIERKLTTLGDTGLKPATLNRYRTLLSLIYSLAIRNGKLFVNPVRSVKRRKENNERVRFLEEREELALRERIRELYPEREPEFDLALHTGMRRGEQYQLCWQDIDVSNGIITIRRSKHGEARHIQINSVARAALLKLRERTCGPGFVCPGLDNSRKRYSRQWFEEVTEHASISNFHWHDLRHTFASRLVMAGVPLRAVQVLMGHKRIETTLRYSHLAEDHLRNAVERLVGGEPPMSSQKAPNQLPPELPPAKITRQLADRRIRRKLLRMCGARERTRTSTPLRELAPEASASANSATRAMLVCGKIKPRGSTILTRAPQFVNAAHRQQEVLTRPHVRTTLNRWARGEQETKTWQPPARCWSAAARRAFSFASRYNCSATAWTASRASLLPKPSPSAAAARWFALRSNPASARASNS